MDCNSLFTLAAIFSVTGLVIRHYDEKAAEAGSKRDVLTQRIEVLEKKLDGEIKKLRKSINELEEKADDAVNTKRFINKQVFLIHSRLDGLEKE